MRNRSTKGFTLIELLIVIAIIGILAAVLIPNLLSARSRAQDAAAQACAKEILTQAEIFNIDEQTYVGFDVNLAGYEVNACGTQVSAAPTPTTLTPTEVAGTVTSLSGATVAYANNAPMTVTQP